MNRQSFLEYLGTFFITILTIFVIVIFLFLFDFSNQVYQQDMNIAQEEQEDSVDYNLVMLLIDKSKYWEKQYPQNYKINLKLGFLYEIIKDYKNSEIEYRKAISKAPYMEFFPTYKLANLYIILGRLDDAQYLIDKLEERPNKKIIEYKADIYNKIGDAYYNNSDYENASFKYQKSLSYYKIIKSDNISAVKNSLASSYVYFAEEKVKNLQIDTAIISLKKALKIIDAPIIKYKLALLLTQDDPYLAYEYFEQIFKDAPEIINYEEYINFLSILALNEIEQGNIVQAELFKYKIKKLNEYLNTNIFSVDDLKIEYIEGIFTTNNSSKNSNIYLQLKFKNVSKYDFNSLYLKVIFKHKDLVLGEYFEQIISKQSILKAKTYSPIIAIKMLKLPINTKDKLDNITAEIYVSKTDKSYQLLLKTFDIKPKIKKNKIKTMFQGIYKRVISIFFSNS